MYTSIAWFVNLRDVKSPCKKVFRFHFIAEVNPFARIIIDILVENEIILELKSIEGILKVHEAQLITYLKLADKRLGFLINFNVPLLKQGFKRFVNKFEL